jgi:hypothetical protein
MNIYTFYDTLGKILFSTDCSDEVLTLLMVEHSGRGIKGTYSSLEFYVKDGIATRFPTKPDEFHIFNYDLSSWEVSDYYVNQVREVYTNRVNNIASELILNKYPVYKQLNNIGTEEYLPMRNYIDGIRNLANIATDAISIATTATYCELLKETFIQNAGSLEVIYP